MSTVTAGNPVTLDALFAQAGQPSPDFVTFTVEAPDGTIVTLSTGDPQVTNPTGDYWEAALGVPAEVGEYRWQATGQAASSVTETVYGTVFVIPSAVDPAPPAPPGPQLGPCETWITGDDVAACPTVNAGSNPAVLDTVAYEASMALYEISGRKFTGLCTRVVRPCRTACSCWLGGPASYGMTPFWWTGGTYGLGGGWLWANERGDRVGCKPMSTVELAGYPVREITEVLIDGAVLPELDDDGNPNWRLDQWLHLVRMDAPGPPVAPRFWPGCQNMSLSADQPGTFQVRYRWGVDPPALGRGAAVELANQLWLACNGQACVLPAGVTKVVRQGIEVERGLLANWLDPAKGTGLVQTDLFLQAYAGGGRRQRASAVWSPDVQQKARAVGTHPTGGS